MFCSFLIVSIISNGVLTLVDSSSNLIASKSLGLLSSSKDFLFSVGLNCTFQSLVVIVSILNVSLISCTISLLTCAVSILSTHEFFRVSTLAFWLDDRLVSSSLNASLAFSAQIW